LKDKKTITMKLNKKIIMKKEIWKDIKGYKGLYQVSNCGRIKSLPRKSPNCGSWHLRKSQILKPYKNPKPTLSNPENYLLYIGLRKDGVTKYKPVHRLVAETFFLKFKKELLVKKKKKNADDNSVKNLVISKFGGIRVTQFSSRGRKMREFHNIVQASEFTGVASGGISYCSGGIWSKAGGFIWERTSKK
jgi:hypothetical protein